MTDDEAREILAKSDAWVDWDDEQRKPRIEIGFCEGPMINVDGYLTLGEMQALIHFMVPE